MSKKICAECKHFAFRDVFKGFCEKKNQSAIIDTDALKCKEYSKVDVSPFIHNVAEQLNLAASAPVQK